MSAVDTSQSAGKGGSQEFDLNLAPIIDCLTVLITFMLASASFLSIGILDAGVAAAGAAANDTAPPPVNITVEIGKDQNFVVKVTGKQNSTIPISRGSAAQGYDFDALSQNLAGLRQKWPTVNAVTLAADNNVEYRDIVKSMEALRKNVPVVLLGGF